MLFYIYEQVKDIYIEVVLSLMTQFHISQFCGFGLKYV